LTPEEFVRGILAGRLKARAVLVGDTSDSEIAPPVTANTLVELGRKYGSRWKLPAPIAWRKPNYLEAAKFGGDRSGRRRARLPYVGRPYTWGAVVRRRRSW